MNRYVILLTVIEMTYQNIIRGEFISRPNRFIANVLINGQQQVCHVKNTGRCKELLVAGAEVWVEKCSDPARKTAYDLIAVKKGDRLINIDSQAPNKAVAEWLEREKPFGAELKLLREQTYGGSRFDIMLKSDKTDKRIYIEVKGCTLERDGIALFPDAPTERGVKHLRELAECRRNGNVAALFVLVQMSDISYFSPNYETHREFGEVMKEAQRCGVRLMCYDSIVTPDSLIVGKPVKIKL